MYIPEKLIYIIIIGLLLLLNLALCVYLQKAENRIEALKDSKRQLIRRCEEAERLSERRRQDDIMRIARQDTAYQGRHERGADNVCM